MAENDWEADVIDNAIGSMFAIVGWLQHRRLRQVIRPVPDLDLVAEAQKISDDLIAMSWNSGPDSRETMRAYLEEKRAQAPKLEYDPPTELEAQITVVIRGLKELKRQEIKVHSVSVGEGTR